MALAYLVPPRERVYDLFYYLSKVVVAFLFFLHGAKLTPKNLLDGLTNWKVHLAILVATFILFPSLVVLLRPLLLFLHSPEFYVGFLFLASLPSTVQSAIAFTSLAKGNVAVAICAASASSLLGVIVTPLLVGFLIHVEGTTPKLQAIWDLTLQLVVPFILGQIVRPYLRDLLTRNQVIIGATDRLSVIFIVYVSFSHSVTQGLWANFTFKDIFSLILTASLLLACALIITSQAGKFLRFPEADRRALIFCGSKKSLMTGVPMANILFSAGLAGLVILPLIIFHQIQLIVSAQLARYLATKEEL
jgi:sodium/bile acid cotransporter 7